MMKHVMVYHGLPTDNARVWRDTLTDDSPVFRVVISGGIRTCTLYCSCELSAISLCDRINADSVTEVVIKD